MKTILSFGLIIAYSLFAADDAATLRDKGLAALQKSQTVPDEVVSATKYFAQASELFARQGLESEAQEANSYLYWCKKKMTMQQINSFLNSAELGSAAKQFDRATIAKPVDEAKAYFERAEAFAKGHPEDHLLRAIRYFEVADRFTGTEWSIKAQRLSLEDQQEAMKENTAARTVLAAEGVVGAWKVLDKEGKEIGEMTFYGNGGIRNRSGSRKSDYHWTLTKEGNLYLKWVTDDDTYVRIGESKFYNVQRDFNNWLVKSGGLSPQDIAAAQQVHKTAPVQHKSRASRNRIPQAVDVLPTWPPSPDILKKLSPAKVQVLPPPKLLEELKGGEFKNFEESVHKLQSDPATWTKDDFKARFDGWQNLCYAANGYLAFDYVNGRSKETSKQSATSQFRLGYTLAAKTLEDFVDRVKTSGIDQRRIVQSYARRHRAEFRTTALREKFCDTVIKLGLEDQDIETFRRNGLP